jgi:hypothetical protein
MVLCYNLNSVNVIVNCEMLLAHQYKNKYITMWKMILYSYSKSK